MPTNHRTATVAEDLEAHPRTSTELLWQKTFVGLPMAQAAKMYPEAKVRPSGNALHLTTQLLRHRFEASLIFDDARKLQQVFLDLHEHVEVENGETILQQLVMLLREKYGAEQGRRPSHGGMGSVVFWQTPNCVTVELTLFSGARDARIALSYSGPR